MAGLFYENRNILYARIEKRVDQMIADGLVTETRALFEEGVLEANKTAAQAIGYKELLGYVCGNETLENAVNELKTATRRYAKRQITWFGAKDYVSHVIMDTDGEPKTFEKIVNNVEKLFSL